MRARRSCAESNGQKEEKKKKKRWKTDKFSRIDPLFIARDFPRSRYFRFEVVINSVDAGIYTSINFRCIYPLTPTGIFAINETIFHYALIS